MLPTIIGSSALVYAAVRHRKQQPVAFKQTPLIPSEKRPPSADLFKLIGEVQVPSDHHRTCTFQLELERQKKCLDDTTVKSLAKQAITFHHAEAFNLLANHFPEIVNTELLKETYLSPNFVFRMGIIEGEGRKAASLYNYTVLPAERPELRSDLLQHPGKTDFFSTHRFGEYDGETSQETIPPGCSRS